MVKGGVGIEFEPEKSAFAVFLLPPLSDFKLKTEVGTPFLERGYR